MDAEKGDTQSRENTPNVKPSSKRGILHLFVVAAGLYTLCNYLLRIDWRPLCHMSRPKPIPAVSHVHDGLVPLEAHIMYVLLRSMLKSHSSLNEGQNAPTHRIASASS